jgi:hypothetical protein
MRNEDSLYGTRIARGQCLLVDRHSEKRKVTFNIGAPQGAYCYCSARNAFDFSETIHFIVADQQPYAALKRVGDIVNNGRASVCFMPFSQR